MSTLLLVSTCLGIGIFIGMALSAAFSTGRDRDISHVAEVFPAKSCYQCARLRDQVDEAM